MIDPPANGHFKYTLIGFRYLSEVFLGLNINLPLQSDSRRIHCAAAATDALRSQALSRAGRSIAIGIMMRTVIIIMIASDANDWSFAPVSGFRLIERFIEQASEGRTEGEQVGDARPAR
ncbi:MAG TPA: hypothetical protein VMD06_07145 [Steroidobacteraceae bacterium]|nr:hypothetical protein [Steroidobacteraceae bacterium]